MAFLANRPAHPWGNGGKTRLDGRTLTADFSKGATAVQLGTEEIGLLGTPKEFIQRVRGDASGHPVRLRLATHFMTFEKTMGTFVAGPDGIGEVRTAAPPGEGWGFYGGENDGKIHGPLRISGILLDRGGEFDALTVHPYRTVLDDLAFVDDLRKVSDLVKRPDGTPRPVWITEMGWATFTPHNSLPQDFQPTTQHRQAEFLGRAYVDAVASGNVASISWYDFRNDGADPTNFEHNMGIVTRDFRPKPAYRALATVARQLKGKVPAAPPDFGKGVVAWRFTDPDGKRPVIALWSVGEPATIELPTGTSQAIDLMGHATSCADAHAKLVLPVEQPTFLMQGP